MATFGPKRPETRTNPREFAPGALTHLPGTRSPSGTAGFVVANGVAQSLSSNQSGEGESRKNIIEADRWTASCLAEARSSFFLATSANGSRGNGLPGNCDCRRS